MPIDQAALQIEQTVKECLAQAAHKTGHSFAGVSLQWLGRCQGERKWQRGLRVAINIVINK
jgi:hypothetical protein